MIDDETLLLLNAYLDGELSPSETLAMERRLAAEPELRSRLDAMRGLSGSLKSVLAGDDVPEERLRSRVVSAIRFSDHGQRPAPRYRHWSAMASCLVLGLGLGYMASGFLVPPARESAAISDMVLGAHLRGLATAEPFDVASSDRHVVKPWFNGRTTIAPKAPDLSADGFFLVGGRIDVVRQETVPTMVYTRRQHVISVTVVPSEFGPRSGEETRDGTNIVRWEAGTLVYIAVSDLNLPELRGFAERFRLAP